VRYYNNRGKFKLFLHRTINKLLDILEYIRDSLLPNEVLVNERIIECPLVFKYINSNNGKILDVGRYSSRLPIQLASMGYKVWGIDIRSYNFQHPNFTFKKLIYLLSLLRIISLI
jgi:2-polyprenyl-3-methyl-5-hydroxy-6-metoxy-1,4-benzoquinol methylase